MRKTKKVLLFAVILVVLGSFLASMFHTSFFQVKVKEIEFETERGTLSGLLYMPKGAGEEEPRPVIVTTHGYLNTKEMQDASAIEMSRRGYIVLAVDMYDHGDSRWKDEIKVGEQFATFWIYSQIDAANYMAGQDYTKKDESGNAYLAVSGHSMGGFSTLTAMYMDEMNAVQTGVRSIYTGVSVGADYSYSSAIAPQQEYMAAFGDRTVGMIAAQYDEFFFNKSEEEKSTEEKQIEGTVPRKNFVETASGKMFLGKSGKEEATAGKFYEVDSGVLTYEGNPIREAQTGKHIIYTPSETHPWNHFSRETTADLIRFYDEAFEGVRAKSQTTADLAADNQIWFFKELGNLIAMCGFFLLLVPVMELLLKLPFLKEAKLEKAGVLVAEKTTAQKAGYWISYVLCLLYPGVFFAILMDKQEKGLLVLTVGAIVAAVVGVVLYVRKKEVGFLCATAVSIVTAVIFRFANHVLPLSKSFNEPTTNQIAYWAICNGLIALIVTMFFYAVTKKKEGMTVESYGIKANGRTILASLGTAVFGVAILYAVLFLIQAVFGTDFRFWTMAVRTFKPEFLVVALRYLPFFFIYYLINAVTLNVNTRGRKNGYLMAVGLNIGGLILWMALQYGMDFVTGVSMMPMQALNGILLIATIPCLAVAAMYARKLFEKTNNVWLAAFTNTILFTLITVTNTAMFWNMVNV